ncbi:predicted protein [Nematostella vectensis]|uniref:Glutaredoxin-2, mitochondrial n=2 Tax=Nematostella vectensis TaxID=45351 RepID=A7SJ69_NEMVE|nr:predicted protein [Nematostella vectensis]|eukprot:XP_001628285.1 predicted protein [Nematostella vectensis]
MSTNQAVKDFVEGEISSHKVMMFSKTYCPFCTKAKKALQKAGLQDFHVIEIENRSDGGEIQDYLNKRNRSRTVPQVHINGKFIGGGTETEDLERSGKLLEMLKACGAL